MIFDSCNKPYSDEKNAFSNNWCGPKQYPHMKDVLIAKYPKNPKNGDGQIVEVYCCAMPARFYTLKAYKGHNSAGDSKQGYKITTGSGMWQLAANLAKAISEGMLDFKQNKEKTKK